MLRLQGVEDLVHGLAGQQLPPGLVRGAHPRHQGPALGGEGWPPPQELSTSVITTITVRRVLLTSAVEDAGCQGR